MLRRWLLPRPPLTWNELALEGAGRGKSDPTGHLSQPRMGRAPTAVWILLKHSAHLLIQEGGVCVRWGCFVVFPNSQVMLWSGNHTLRTTDMSERNIHRSPISTSQHLQAAQKYSPTFVKVNIRHSGMSCPRVP